MGFRLALSETYEIEVTVAYPVAGGKVERQKFFAEFKRLTQSELETLLAEAAGGGVKDGEVVRRYMVGWRGVEEEDGKPIDFTPGNLDRLLALHPAQPSIARAFFASVNGAREKN